MQQKVPIVALPGIHNKDRSSQMRCYSQSVLQLLLGHRGTGQLDSGKAEPPESNPKSSSLQHVHSKRYGTRRRCRISASWWLIMSRSLIYSQSALDCNWDIMGRDNLIQEKPSLQNPILRAAVCSMCTRKGMGHDDDAESQPPGG